MGIRGASTKATCYINLTKELHDRHRIRSYGILHSEFRFQEEHALHSSIGKVNFVKGFVRRRLQVHVASHRRSPSAGLSMQTTDLMGLDLRFLLHFLLNLFPPFVVLFCWLRDGDGFDFGYPSGICGCWIYHWLRLLNGLEGNSAHPEESTTMEEPIYLHGLGRDYRQSQHRHYRMGLSWWPHRTNVSIYTPFLTGGGGKARKKGLFTYTNCIHVNDTDMQKHVTYTGLRISFTLNYECWPSNSCL